MSSYFETPVPVNPAFIAVLCVFMVTGLVEPSVAQKPVGRADPVMRTVRPAPESRATSSSQLTRADLEAWLDGFLPYALQQADIAGAVIVVVKNGQILLKKGYGYAGVAKHTPMEALRRGRKIAKVAMARKLAVHLYWMWRQGWDYSQFKYFGSYAGEPGHPMVSGKSPT
jgi:hypothetical protein